MASPYSICAAALEQIINGEFADLAVAARHDNLHESLGRGERFVGIAPTEETVNNRNGLVQETWIEVRFYNPYPQEIDPRTEVDPRIVAEQAERLRAAIRDFHVTSSGSDEVWYFDCQRVTYPNDPTGNKSRFHMSIRAFGRNSALLETS